MKKLIPFVVLIVLYSCDNHPSKTGNMSRNRQVQTIHRFIDALKKSDIKSLKSILPFKDTSSVDTNRYDIHEMIQIQHAQAALEQDSIVTDSLWLSDTIRIEGDLYLSYSATLKKDTGNPESIFRFIFSLDNSDTLFTHFEYNPPKPGQHKTASADKLMDTIYKFIGCLKKNNIEGAQGLLRSLDSSNYADNREDFDDEIGQLNSAQKALQLNDIDETTWQEDTVMIQNVIHIFISDHLKEKPGNPYSNALFQFHFVIWTSDPELWFFKYKPQ